MYRQVFMQADVVWKEGMSFEGRAKGFSVPMDAPMPLGQDFGPTPKELLLMSLSACSAMDVIGLFKKDRQSIDQFKVQTKVESSTSEHPKVFLSVEMIFYRDGPIDQDKAIKAIHLTQTKYCGVSAMLFASAPIHWKLVLNGKELADGETIFDLNQDKEAYQSGHEG